MFLSEFCGLHCFSCPIKDFCLAIYYQRNFYLSPVMMSSVYSMFICKPICIRLKHIIPPAAEVEISSLTLTSRTANTLSVTWSAGYPKCYSFTVSHSTQDGSINVTQPADSDTSHTLTSLQPGTTYRIEVEAVRKGDRADGQRVKVMGNFTTDDVGEENMQKLLMHSSWH